MLCMAKPAAILLRSLSAESLVNNVCDMRAESTSPSVSQISSQLQPFDAETMANEYLPNAQHSAGRTSLPWQLRLHASLQCVCCLKDITLRSPGLIGHSQIASFIYYSKVCICQHCAAVCAPSFECSLSGTCNALHTACS